MECDVTRHFVGLFRGDLQGQPLHEERYEFFPGCGSPAFRSMISTAAKFFFQLLRHERPFINTTATLARQGSLSDIRQELGNAEFGQPEQPPRDQ